MSTVCNPYITMAFLSRHGLLFMYNKSNTAGL